MTYRCSAYAIANMMLLKGTWWRNKVGNENELALHAADMRMFRWKCGVKLSDGLSYVEMRSSSSVY